MGIWAQNTKTIYGRITDQDIPKSGVSVQVQNSERGTTSDAEGKYSISAAEGDVLVFSHIGYVSKEIQIEDVTQVLNVSLSPEITELDDVTVEAQRLNLQEQLALEYDSNPSLIKTAYGIFDKRSAGYSLRILEERHINKSALTLADVINGKFAGVSSFCNTVTGYIVSRMLPMPTIFNQGLPIYDIDGQILTSLPCGLIAPANIIRIAVIPSTAGTNRYGSIASNGVIIINTNRYGRYKPKPAETSYTATYAQDARPYVSTANYPTTKTLQKLADPDRAFTALTKDVLGYCPNYHFALDQSLLFAKHWNRPDLALKVLAKTDALFEGNPEALKAKAYMLEAYGASNEAHETYKSIYRLRPQYLQSLLDMAQSYLAVNEPEKAMDLYMRHEYLVSEGLFKTDSTGQSPIISTDYANLMARYEWNNGLHLKTTKTKTKTTASNARWVLSWNDGEAEFDVEFVNPMGKTFVWSHSLDGNPDQIRYEKELGLSATSETIDASLPGTWQVNLTYLGNKKLTPSYFKLVEYTGYGTPWQEKNSQHFRLIEKGKKTILRTVNVSPMKLSNDQ
jgi:hypothetical protein